MANVSFRQASAHQRRTRFFNYASSEFPDLTRPLTAPSAGESSGSEVARGVKTNNLIGLKALLLDPVNILCVFTPIGVASSILGWSPAWVFATNFIALIPLAKILGDATEELAVGLRNDTLGGLLNATFGNAVEMILTVQSLLKGLVTVVKGTLLGSILSNLLLVLGMSFFFGGIGHLGKEQEFKETGPMTNMSMLLLACAAFAMPTVFEAGFKHEMEKAELQSTVLEISRVVSIFLLLSYICFLIFQMYTHLSIFESEGGENEDEPTINVPTSLTLLLVSTLLVALNSEYLVGSIEGVVSSYSVSSSFIGVILLPIVGNACEHASAIRMCIVDKPEIAIGIAVGSCTQIALFVVPFAVIVGWCMSISMDLNFGMLGVVILVLSVIIAMSIVVNGKTNWLEGLMLQLTYIIVAVVYW
ncbi:calcium/proton exchanger, putative [Perkinsus marinus ATCC 50983]|uniref:Calcium/proton exchanger, putative n=1 Tax=Perkinsus marinus (strain ATCC 50983 / TXsc) TaxID=423536 RepID=C5KCD2_PERM5|nr:calcium/proton exchanger, putative [Perkinsus marinus ATCC 50983]XP_002786063.1 calcium/proton exchanger, putative [Perkinsus marinus ATCC 50983]EEQ97851.1 calcium/proton exchanger, putative [Perkinsus marinus ATCC 50983]EER17859.1 calcium/proton exchanger, putative [Perkinsus marinus ATCC 50983]|eukprot:XP_002765134.1 calcium/proton exchanger, putative [Perkinsus marinus ATCC 50983]